MSLLTPWVSVPHVNLAKNLQLSVIEHYLLIIQPVIFVVVAMTNPTLDLKKKLKTKQKPLFTVKWSIIKLIFSQMYVIIFNSNLLLLSSALLNVSVIMMQNYTMQSRILWQYSFDFIIWNKREMRHWKLVNILWILTMQFKHSYSGINTQIIFLWIIFEVWFLFSI